MRTKSIILSIFIGILFFAFSFSAFAADVTGLEYIKFESQKGPFFDKFNPYGTGARAIGMGESFASIADDASAVYYNPAGLAQLDHNEIFWTGGSLYDDVPYSAFGSFLMALGTQYFALSYQKLYHPKGIWPENVTLEKTVGVVDPTDPTTSDYILGEIAPDTAFMINSGTFDFFGEWRDGGSLQPSQTEFLANVYRDYFNLPFQANSILLSYATPLTGDRSLLFGINVKYSFTDLDTKAYLGDDFDAWAWGLDLGFMYKLRVIEYLKDFNIGIMLRDVSGTIKYYKSGVEKTLPFTTTLAVSARTTELIQKEVTSFSIDLDAITDTRAFNAERFRLKFGFEQWFIDGHFGIRGGLVHFLYPAPMRFTVGLSAKYWLGLDYAYMKGMPFDQQAENEEESHWISVHWEWGKVKRKLPTPDVFAAVEPISFAPKNGETVLFKLSAYSKAGIDRWALNILDKDNNLVKSYVDIGVPPSQIVWNGTDKNYQLMPDGEYTFIFEATDKLGSTASTPVQTVKIFTPVLPDRNTDALMKLKGLLNQIKERDMAEDAAAKTKAETDIAAVKKAKEKPTPAPAPAVAAVPSFTNPFAMAAGMGAQGAQPQGAQAQGAQAQGAPQQQGEMNIVGFPNIDSGAISSAYISTDENGNRAFNMEYATANTLPKYVMQEMALMIRSIADSMGYSVNNIGINAVYGGSNNLSLNVPVAQAQNYSKGIISIDQMLRGANVSLNGEPIYPNF